MYAKPVNRAWEKNRKLNLYVYIIPNDIEIIIRMSNVWRPKQIFIDAIQFRPKAGSMESETGSRSPTKELSVICVFNLNSSLGILSLN